MLRFIVIITMVLAMLLVACGKKQNTADIIHDENAPTDIKSFDLDFGFKVSAGNDDIPLFYTYFKLERNKKVIYLSDSQLEYDFTNFGESFPIILQTGKNSFELLFEIENRPSKNYLKRLFVSNDKLIKEDMVPTFEAKPKDINGDGIKEYAGFWDYFQVGGPDENGEMTTDYNPILYYSVTDTGLKLDSLLTTQQNEKIYGQFQGYEFDPYNSQPYSIMDRFSQAIELIINE